MHDMKEKTWDEKQKKHENLNNVNERKSMKMEEVKKLAKDNLLVNRF